MGNVKWTSIFDWWSFIHFGFWAFIASSIAAGWEPKLWVHWTYVFILGYVWEVFEYWASRKWPDKWSGKIESWLNSWVGDPISNLSGATFGWFVVSYYRNRYFLF
jgi:hypothetical protein